MLAHRADIEGLRGVAVLSVFAVHSVPEALRGGFIGVDVFFVLSGYLIASLTLAEVQRAGRFDVAAFYARRLRRLAPALLVVLLACLAFATFVALPKDARDIGRHVAGGAAFVSNLVLWREAGYFDQSAERKLLLHLWSLGIEEQFYLLWPLAVPWLARRRWRGLPWVAAGVALSFALNVAFVDSKPKGTFFLPPTRFWELGAGVLLAYSRCAPPARWADGLGVAGVALLVAALASIDRTDHFPGWWAVLPTAATCLLIAAGPQSWINRRVLSQPVLTFYGRISYPLYLWHWPLLTMPLLMGRPRDWELQVAVMVASVVLALLTLHAVERPLRFGRWSAPAPAGLALALVAVAGSALLLVLEDGHLGRYPPEVRPIAEIHLRSDYEAYRVDRCFLRSEQGPAQFSPDCVDGPGTGTRPLWLLWGDSHAAALFPGLRSRDLRLAQFTAAACPPGWRAATPNNPHCAVVNASVLERVAALRPQNAMLAANWPDVEAGGPTRFEVLRDSVAQLRARGVERIWIVGPLPRWPYEPPRHLLAAWSEGQALPERGPEPLTAGALALDRELAAEAAALGAAYLSPLQTLCNTLGCLLALRDTGARWQAVSFDETHLGATASARLVQSWPLEGGP